MIYSSGVDKMTCVAKGPNHGPAPKQQKGRWVQSKEIKDIAGLTHGVGWCASQQGACKLTLNVMDGIIEEAETIGCSGMTHSAAIPMPITHYAFCFDRGSGRPLGQRDLMGHQ